MAPQSYMYQFIIYLSNKDQNPAPAGSASINAKERERERKKFKLNRIYAFRSVISFLMDKFICKFCDILPMYLYMSLDV